MSFIADKQTIDDLNLTGRFKQGSVFNLFNKVKTRGGEQLLESMFKHPLTNHEKINERSSLFAYFRNESPDFPIDGEKFEAARNYLDSEVAASALIAGAGQIIKSLQARLIKDEQFDLLKAGFQATVITLRSCKSFFRKLDKDNSPFDKQIVWVNTLFDNSRWSWLDEIFDAKKLPILKFSSYDHFLRSVMKDEIRSLFEIIHELDVYVAVAKVAADNDFCFAIAFPKEAQHFNAVEVRHPSLRKAIGNDISLTRQDNVVFLTGANMAGKSTLMKTIGISFYLAHMGFPLAAAQMEFSVKGGIFSSINTPDDLKMGYSHFYAEVMRVKKVAEEVSLGTDLFVIFDELFKGTNVKDAYDATLAVTAAFAMYDNCFFIISTHIIEVGEALKHTCHNLQFKYLPTVVENNIPKYTYKLNEGITSDRQGMMIIENEGVIDLLNFASESDSLNNEFPNAH